MSCHGGEQGREDTDNASGHHVRVHCSHPAAVLQRDHFPGGEGKSPHCFLTLNSAAGDAEPVGCVCLCSKEKMRELLPVHRALVTDWSRTQLCHESSDDSFAAVGLGTVSPAALLLSRQN